MMEAQNNYSIFLTDDHQLFLDGLVRILENEPDFSIAGIYRSGEELLHGLNRMVPDLVILDVQMPGPDGIALCREIKRRLPGIKVLFISMFDLPQLIRDSKAAGANGYLTKSTDADVVKETIRAVLHGEDLFARSEKGENSQAVINPTVYVLTNREKEIIQLVKDGKTTKVIAHMLHLSHYTVETHRKNIFRKLRISSVSELIAFAYKSGL
ncbi:response regulator transcription factor [Sinomicrobium soli]|uniref:response regulator transcription factor n=1 Tax=Sinomicrobium sp. N-1-3-6 TaxID=2219864 RepID=UPI000DCC5003|nr:response regulator transcription factor [Sinomicrobium sp. N-1-3-6]RAV27638.1 DNA-binding response regulator [Sinomicrobium sp. N-1-3-6]